MSQGYDYDLVIIGAGVGGHGAALHAVSCGLKTAIIEAADMGGTCVNRGCIPSKALLAASGRVRDLRNAHHLKSLGIQIGSVEFDRQAIADHATNLVSKIQGDLTNSLKRLGVDIIRGWGKVAGTQKVSVTGDGGDKTITAKDIILSPGSVPFVPPGIEVDGKTVFTSDQGVKLESLPNWVAIIGSGYIGTLSDRFQKTCACQDSKPCLAYFAKKNSKFVKSQESRAKKNSKFVKSQESRVKSQESKVKSPESRRLLNFELIVPCPMPNAQRPMPHLRIKYSEYPSFMMILKIFSPFAC